MRYKGSGEQTVKWEPFIGHSMTANNLLTGRYASRVHRGSQVRRPLQGIYFDLSLVSQRVPDVR